MPVSISGTNGVTFPDNSLQTAAASPYVLKNRIINGDMRIDQRNAGASVTAVDGQYIVDRFNAGVSQTGKLTWQQNAGSVTPPVGFTNYLGVTSTSAYSSLSTDYFIITHKVEGFNIADLAWGTANAKTVTLSFWVRSSLTGTFGGALRNSATNRGYGFNYTISAANTWEQKTITIPGDTTGTWLTNNFIGIEIHINLGTGSTYSVAAGTWTAGNYVSATGSQSVVGTNGATFYITGVQLEVGTSATPFERRMYGQELALCQRYCELSGNGASGAVGQTTTYREVGLIFAVQKRASPSLSFSGTVTVSQAAVGNQNATSPTVAFSDITTAGVHLAISGFTAGTSYRPCWLVTDSILSSAEL